MSERINSGIELLTPWSRLSRCRTDVPLRERLLEAAGDAMVSIDEALQMVQSEPASGLDSTMEDLRNCHHLLERVMQRIAD